MCQESQNKRVGEKPFVSSLLNLPFFKETDEDTQDQGDDEPDVPDVLSIQKALSDESLCACAHYKNKHH